ncbi:hypothetical protein HBA54_04810 [Pelagibius litoralis]|uniref:Uncharacterized protein n=1 Tax=Pelagibius litoralis TaxID=374515 RepID=A0A967C1S7_9PROT|nr:hypothetical protein [Pelagibius litoralis]NIA67906.1 hypothetical protein [Pelagibius litoralis]
MAARLETTPPVPLVPIAQLGQSEVTAAPFAAPDGLAIGTNGTNGTAYENVGDREERAAIMEFCGELPRQEAERLAQEEPEQVSRHFDAKPEPIVWRDRIEALRRTLPPRGITAEWWGDLQAASIGFLEAWGHKAADLGWTAPELFGLDPAAPYERIGAWGLCPMLCGARRRSVVELHNDHAIMMAHGHRQRYGRKPLPHSLPLWELVR